MLTSKELVVELALDPGLMIQQGRALGIGVVSTSELGRPSRLGDPLCVLIGGPLTVDFGGVAIGRRCRLIHERCPFGRRGQVILDRVGVQILSSRS